MVKLETRTLVFIGIGALLLLVLAFFLGRTTADGGSETAAGPESTTSSLIEGESTTADTTDTTVSASGGDPSAAVITDPDRPDPLPVYGTEEDREALISGLAEAGVGIGSRTTVLWVADSVCYDLERLIAQNRTPVFAVRVVWNETLSELDSADAAAFGAVFSAAPFYLCPDTIEFSEEVAYWLGI